MQDLDLRSNKCPQPRASSPQSTTQKQTKILAFLDFLSLRMDAPPIFSTFGCELKIIRAKNAELMIKSAGDLFVRCYLSAGNNSRVRLNSKEISSDSDLSWNESFSLECLGTEDSISSLRHGNVVFELRWRRRRSAPFFGRIGGSKLLGRAEIPWKTVFESPNMEIETWFAMNISKNSQVHEDVKPPAVLVNMKVRDAAERIKRNNNDASRKSDKCGCNDGGCHNVDYDIFAVGFALESL